MVGSIDKGSVVGFHKDLFCACCCGTSDTIGLIRPQMKYLGLTLDGRWSFASHFAQLAPKLLNAAGALSRLRPNIGGPDFPSRQLYGWILLLLAIKLICEKLNES